VPYRNLVETNPKRRLRFSLRTLLLFVLAASAGLGLWHGFAAWRPIQLSTSPDKFRFGYWLRGFDRLVIERHLKEPVNYPQEDIGVLEIWDPHAVRRLAVSDAVTEDSTSYGSITAVADTWIATIRQTRQPSAAGRKSWGMSTQGNTVGTGGPGAAGTAGPNTTLVEPGDPEYLATGARILNPVTGEILAEPDGVVHSGTRWLTAGRDEFAVLRREDTSGSLLSMDDRRVIAAYPAEIGSLENINSDGKNLIFLKQYDEKIIAWNSQTRKQVWRADLEENDWLQDSKLSPDERWLTAQTGFRKIYLFELKTGKLMGKSPQFETPVTADMYLKYQHFDHEFALDGDMIVGWNTPIINEVVAWDVPGMNRRKIDLQRVYEIYDDHIVFGARIREGNAELLYIDLRNWNETTLWTEIYPVPNPNRDLRIPYAFESCGVIAPLNRYSIVDCYGVDKTRIMLVDLAAQRILWNELLESESWLVTENGKYLYLSSSEGDNSAQGGASTGGNVPPVGTSTLQCLDLKTGKRLAQRTWNFPGGFHFGSSNESPYAYSQGAQPRGGGQGLSAQTNPSFLLQMMEGEARLLLHWQGFDKHEVLDAQTLETLHEGPGENEGGAPRLTERDRLQFSPAWGPNWYITGTKAGEQILWKRQRPERWWGVLCLWEFWAALIFSLALLGSLRRDWRGLATGA
jgi:hypothetical protein